MECVQGALKTNVLPNNTHSFTHEFSPVNALPSDDFFVDGLLDFSDDGDFEEEKVVANDVSDNTSDKHFCASPLKLENNNGFTIQESDLCLPADDVANLEWVSHFVEDCGYSLTCKVPEKKLESEPVSLVNVNPSFTTPVQTKARSKRFRTGGRVWSLGSNPLTDSSTSSSSSSSCTSTNPWLFFHDSNQTAESFFGKKPLMKIKKKKTLTGPVEPVQPRRCSHCGVQKTPQWRAGPLGVKTLCNACGVRFKSGRLLPEYRPASSPTFSSGVHSNNHRKVLEMRMQKEAVEPGLQLPVQRLKKDLGNT